MGLSLVEFFIVYIGSALVAYTFASWTSGWIWGCVVVAAFRRLIREWETEDEGYVIEDEVAGDANTYQQIPDYDSVLWRRKFSFCQTDIIIVLLVVLGVSFSDWVLFRSIWKALFHLFRRYFEAYFDPSSLEPMETPTSFFK